MNNTDSVIRTKGSLCSGVGSLDLATPGELQWVAENNPAASRVLKREHPEVPNLVDITADDFDPPHVDLVTSGDPCQSMSIAGAKRASDDERFLWHDVMRTIDRIKPREVFLENVQNIVSVALVKGGDRGGVLKLRLDNLREAGYAVRWTVLGACAVGAPHHRHRWFLRAVHVGGTPEAERLVNKCGAPRSGGRMILLSPRASDGQRGGEGDRASRTGTGGTLLDAVKLLATPTARDGNSRGEGSAEWWQHRLATRPDRATKGMPLGAQVALLPTPVVSDLNSNPSPRSRARSHGGVNLPLAAQLLLPTPRATDGVNGGPGQRGSRGDLAMGSAVQKEHWGKFASAIALWEQVTGIPAPDPTVPAPRGGRRLNPALSEWMMGYRPGYLTDELERNDALRCAGNSVVTLQAQAAWEMLG